MHTFLGEKFKQRKNKGFSQNPSFYFGAMCFVLFSFLFFWSDSLAEINYLEDSKAVFFNPFFKDADNLGSDKTFFFGQNNEFFSETPDLTLIQENSIYAVSTPSILNTQVLGDVFGSYQNHREEVINYEVRTGDTIKELAEKFGISEDTIIWANNLSKGSVLKVGQNLAILPVSGVMHIVKEGDTLNQLASKYKVPENEVVAFNGLASSQDIFIGDFLIFPGGTVPPKTSPPANIQLPLADNFFIIPVEGLITQHLHYVNAIDVANKCGTPVYAAASGIVQRAIGNGAGYLGSNYITILHSNGVVTYYGHVSTLFVKSGQIVNVGDRIALMGGAKGEVGSGHSTGCHLHFDVIGAKNPLAKYFKGTVIRYNE